VNDDEIVADASAILAALKNERFDKIDPLRVIGSSISAVNFCEVLTRLAADGLTEAQADAALASTDLRVFPFDQQQAGVAAQLWLTTRHAGLSLGDRACLALGKLRRRPVITADRVWARIDVGVQIILIR
jgi:PIN domain nuclease of toxin-antitoxin system